MKLNPMKLGVAGGILGGLCLFVSTLLAANTGYAANWLQMLESVFPGYHVTNEGSIVGLLYGFLDGFIKLFLLGWLYNALSCCCKCDSECNTKCDINHKDKDNHHKDIQYK